MKSVRNNRFSRHRQNLTSSLRLSVLNSPCLSEMIMSSCIRDGVRKMMDSVFQLKNIHILVLGLPQTGKTTLCLKIMGNKEELPDCIIETVGECVRPLIEFKKTYHFKRTKVCFTELAHPGKRNSLDFVHEKSLHPEYFYSRAHGIIYVMDVSRPERVEEAKDEIHELLTNDFVRGKPVLIFGTHSNDITSKCFGPSTLTSMMGLRPLSRLTKSIFLLSLVDFDTDRKEITGSVKWLVNLLYTHYDEYNDRITNEELIYGQKQRIRTIQVKALKTASSNIKNELKFHTKTKRNQIINYSSKPEFNQYEHEEDEAIVPGIVDNVKEHSSSHQIKNNPFIITHPISPFHYRQIVNTVVHGQDIKPIEIDEESRDPDPNPMLMMTQRGSGDRIKANCSVNEEQEDNAGAGEKERDNKNEVFGIGTGAGANYGNIG